VLFYGVGAIAAALAAGGSVPLIAVGLFAAGLSMDLLRMAGLRGGD